MIATEIMQEAHILNGTYSPLEAKSILMCVIDKQINFYKMQYLSQWEKDHSLSREVLNRKIESLNAKKADIMEFIKEALNEGQKVHLGGSIQLSLAD